MGPEVKQQNKKKKTKKANIYPFHFVKTTAQGSGRLMLWDK